MQRERTIFPLICGSPDISSCEKREEQKTKWIMDKSFLCIEKADHIQVAETRILFLSNRYTVQPLHPLGERFQKILLKLPGSLRIDVSGTCFLEKLLGEVRASAPSSCGMHPPKRYSKQHAHIEHCPPTTLQHHGLLKRGLSRGAWFMWFRGPGLCLVLGVWGGTSTLDIKLEPSFPGTERR